MLHQLLGVKLRDLVVGNRTRSQGDRDATAVGLLDKSRQLQKALALFARIGQRAAHQVDVADLGLVDHRVQRFLHALQRRWRNLDPACLLPQVHGAFVGRAISAEAAAHGDAVLLVQKVLTARRNIDHQHVAVGGDAGLCKRQSVHCLLHQPGPQGLELDRHTAAAPVIDQAITLCLIALHLPR